MAEQEEAFPFVWGPREMFLGFLPDPYQSVGENVSRYYELWHDADGGGLTQFAAGCRLTDHLESDWKDWTVMLLTEMTEEDMYGNRFLDFPHFISSILLHWINNPNHHFPLPPSPPSAPIFVPHPTVPTPPAVISLLFLISSHAPPSSTIPLPSHSPIPFHYPPFQGTWEPVPMESETFLQPLYNDHPWVLDLVPHAHYYYYPDTISLPVYPPTPSSPPLPAAPPNTPRSPVEIKLEPVSSLYNSYDYDSDMIPDYVFL